MVKTVSVFEVVLLEDAGLSETPAPEEHVDVRFLLSATATECHTQRGATPVPCRLLGSADTRTGSAGWLVLGFPRHLWSGDLWSPREVWMSRLLHVHGRPWMLAVSLELGWDSRQGLVLASQCLETRC